MFKIGEHVTRVEHFISGSRDSDWTVTEIGNDFVDINCSVSSSPRRYRQFQLVSSTEINKFKVGENVVTEDGRTITITEIQGLTVISGNTAYNCWNLDKLNSKKLKDIDKIQDEAKKDFVLKLYHDFNRKTIDDVRDLYRCRFFSESNRYCVDDYAKRLVSMKKDKARLMKESMTLADNHDANYKLREILENENYYNSEITEKNKETVSLKEKIKNLTKKLNSNVGYSPVKTISSQYDTIVNHASVESVRVVDDNIFVDTKELLYQDLRNPDDIIVDAPIGRFKLRIPVGGGSLPGATNMSFHVSRHLAHPCIKCYGSICTGSDLQSSISKALKLKEYDMVVYQLINFIEEPNYGSPYSDFKIWFKCKQPVTMKPKKDIDWFCEYQWETHEKWERKLADKMQSEYEEEERQRIAMLQAERLNTAGSNTIFI